MLDELFILGLYLALAMLFVWAFRNLPDERWQIMGCIPAKRNDDGAWRGVNLTWYGFFNALAISSAVAVFCTLSTAAGQSIFAALGIAALAMAICLPAASIVARLVEGKRSTLSVGGASFVGMLILPWVIFLVSVVTESLSFQPVAVLPLLAAVSIAYAFGEGIGRLACVSFGCCYGKKISDCPSWIQSLFAKSCFVFSGKTKKIAYAHQLDGQRVFPVQALTAVILCLTGLVGFYLFLKGFLAAAFLLTLTVSQLWRLISEVLRADYRGRGRISAYQVMAGAAVVYGWGVAWLFGEATALPVHLAEGLVALWRPGVILFFGILFAVSFLYTGKSSVTDCVIRIDVVKEKI
ncbi:MAG TPA: prolipoprotein diacylglyceryl transferase [Smithellaceae bacterium]|mgnify:FL=1|nr:prolipoprotein diacylglyceryl transferase [Smithellaceae bacterium]